MYVIKDFNSISEQATKSVVAIGNFDGVHLGHKQVIGKAVDIAGKLNLKPAIMTFEPHPAVIFGGYKDDFMITSIRQKQDLVKSLGVDIYFEIDFSKEFSLISADAFVDDYLCKKLKVKHVITGYDFTFGHKRLGNTELLERKAQGYSYTKIEAVGDGDIYSSTRVRELIKSGEIKKANEILGQSFKIEGIVIKGQQKARQLGFATANIKLGNYVKPKYGVYAVNIKVDNDFYKAIANVGVKPTFDIKEELLEVHIFNFDKDIYGAMVEVEFLDFIREELKFNSLDALKKQIKYDISTIC